MTERVTGIGPVESRDRRAAERRTLDRRAKLPVKAAEAFEPEPAEPPARPAPAPIADAGAAAFAAQLIGQSGQRRGLKGGPPVLDAARSTYLGAEYSGGAERRPRPGKAEDTDI